MTDFPRDNLECGGSTCAPDGSRKSGGRASGEPVRRNAPEPPLYRRSVLSGYCPDALFAYGSPEVRPPKLLTIRFTGRLILAMLIVCGIDPVWACPVPVFRYALERGTAGQYSLSVTHSGGLSGEHRQLLARLSHPGVPAVELLDLAAPPAESATGETDPPLVPPFMPWLVLRHQLHTNEAAQVTWEGPLNRETVEQLLNAPDRAEIARRILSGESAVWLVFPGTNAAENAAVMERLNRVLAAAEKQLALPRADVGRNQTGGPPASAARPARPLALQGGDSSSSSIPLKLSFSVLTIAPGTPGGDLLKKMLLPIAPDLESLHSPAVAPVYGRGHALAVMTGNDLSESHLRLTCEFLTGNCSCIYKTRNPGVDLFFALDWQAKVVDRPEAAARPQRPGFPAPPPPKPVESGKE